MYAITGITGRVGGAVARNLLSVCQPVRAVVRDADKGRVWSDLGCEVALAEMEDAEALTRAFTDVTAVFILPPPVFDPQPGFPEAKAVIRAVRQALDATRPAKVVCLSTIGAQAAQSNLLSQRTRGQGDADGRHRRRGLGRRRIVAARLDWQADRGARGSGVGEPGPDRGGAFEGAASSGSSTGRSAQELAR
jgi:nucleoside-diphosphate-sugar epimerase